jgi:hypothetical protein
MAHCADQQSSFTVQGVKLNVAMNGDCSLNELYLNFAILQSMYIELKLNVAEMGLNQ